MKPTSNIDKGLKAEFNTLVKKTDKNLDFSEIPELDFDELDRPIVGKFYRPVKKPISLRMDADVLEWFKSHNAHYQKLINKACRLYIYLYEHPRKQRYIAQDKAKYF